MKILLILSLFLFFMVLVGFASAEIRINEVMPHDNNNYSKEWVELYNSGPSDILITNWIISDGTGNDTINVTLNASSYALIIEGSSGNCSFFNISTENCFEVATIGTSGLKDDNESVILFNSSTLISNFSWGYSITSSGKSFGYNGTSWQNCTPTPGTVNNCTIIPPTCTFSSTCGSWSTCSGSSQTKTCTNTSTNCQNTTYTINQSCSSSNSINLEMDWTEEEIINGEEFSITLNVENLEEDNYAVRVWIENDDEDIISERYGNYSNDGDVWVSGRYYIYNFFKDSGDDSASIKLRINEEYSTFSGDAKIFFALKDGDEEEISEDITILEKELEDTGNNDSEASDDLILTSIQNNGGLIPGSSVITLTPKANLTTKKENSIIYKSKTEYIREYAPYAFSLICIFIMILIIMDNKQSKR